MRQPAYPPLPPREMLPARTLNLPGRGEVFLRDSGGDGPPAMLLHGWMASADLNWHASYMPLVEAGYRVLAIDHRGHGRGMRPLAPFRLVDCAADAAAAVELLGLAPATFVGYSMGGAIAQLVARDHRAAAGGIVLSATAQHWQDPETSRIWKWMGVVGLDVVGRSARDLERRLQASPDPGLAADLVVGVGDDASLGARPCRGGPRAEPLRLAPLVA